MATIKDTLAEIKKELRANMNGVASAAMRHTDDYRLNWGIELPRLQTIASEFQPGCELAQALWNESVRECRILACMLMPADEFSEELADLWAENIRTEEMAQMMCHLLVPRLRFAGKKAFEWMASDRPLLRTCGLLTMCHLVRLHPLSDSAEAEFLDQAASMLPDKYAVRALRIYASLCATNEDKVKKIADYL